MPIKDFIHHYPRALFNDIPRVGAHFYDIPGSGRTLTTYPGRDALLRHTQVGAQFNDIPGSRGHGIGTKVRGTHTNPPKLYSFVGNEQHGTTSIFNNIKSTKILPINKKLIKVDSLNPSEPTIY